MFDAVRARIKPASEAAGPLNIALYGRQKAGKTRFAGSSDHKTLVIDCREQGNETLRGRPNVDVYSLVKFTEFDPILKMLQSGDHDYEVVAVDTLSMLSTIGLKHLLGPSGGDTTGDPFLPAGGHYQKLTQLMENVILDLRDLPIHTIFLCQEQVNTVKNDEGDDIVERVGPALTPKVQQTLLSCVGTIARIYTEEVTIEKDDGSETTAVARRLLLSAHPRFEAGSRIHGVPRVMKSPTLAKLLAIRDKNGEAPLASED